MVKVKEDLTGRIFGSLTVIKQVEDYINPQGKPYAKWLCKCNCGIEKEIIGAILLSGHTKSCGCLRRNLTDFVKIKEDLTGQIFGKLTVIKQVEDYVSPSNEHRAQWLCKCECGNEIKVIGKRLKNRDVKNCGCEKTSRIEDLTGKVFGRLTVIKRVEDHITPKGKHQAKWLCECNCEQHTQKKILGDSLKKGATKSCGCLNTENRHLLKKYNDYILNLKDEFGLYGVGFCSNTNHEFYFDMDDYDIIKNYCWYYAKDNKNTNSTPKIKTTAIKNKNGKQTKSTFSMHILLGYKNYDHIDRNELNNRKHNLRLATFQQNTWNRSLSKRNTSGFMGVYWINNRNKWVARIECNKKRMSLGYFTEKEDAIRARLQAEKEYFGEFAPQRHLFEEYGIEDDFSTNKKEE